MLLLARVKLQSFHANVVFLDIQVWWPLYNFLIMDVVGKLVAVSIILWLSIVCKNRPNSGRAC
jgi:hypothetical protein